jgi:lysophospholipase L1-like esterase
MSHHCFLKTVVFAACLFSLNMFMSAHADTPTETKKTAADKPVAPAQPAKPKKVHPSLVPVKEVPGLPRVLLIGDSVSMGYTVPVRDLLKGKANVLRAPENTHHTRNVLEQLDNYLGKEKWDVILINSGGHDLTFIKDEKPVPPPEGKIRVTIDEYEKNLHTIIQRLKKSNAKIIWAMTTPMGEVYIQKKIRTEEDIVKYNAVAAKVMKEEGIIVNDLYKLSKPNTDKLLKDGVHFTDEGYKFLAKSLVESINKELPPAKPESK